MLDTKKQTALDWYIGKRNKLEHAHGTYEISLVTYFARKEEIENQAKQMEKEQIINAHIHAQFKVIEAKKEFAEKYFNDFYGVTKN